MILLSIGISVFSQSFEGTLKYIATLDVSPELQKKGVNKEMLLNKMKKDGTWYDSITINYKNGNYYSLANNSFKTCTIYLSDSNKIYTMNLEGEDSVICTVIDAFVDVEYSMFNKMPTIEKLDSQVVVNGINCQIVRIKWKSGIYDYYFNSSNLIVDPFLFEKHIYDGWSEF